MLAAVAAKVRERAPAEIFKRDVYSGLVAELSEVPDLAEVLCWTEPFDLLRDMGFSDPKWFMAFLIQKPPWAPRLYWHQDWWGWADPETYLNQPLLLFFMLYLVDVTPTNGCLRVLPGSHRTEHELHRRSALADHLGYDGADSDPLLAFAPGERDVPARKGDLIIRDARLLHATHANATDAWRPMLSLSVAPDFGSLSLPIRRTMEIKRPKIERRWSDVAWRRVAPHMSLGPREGQASPLVRIPDFSRPR